MKPQKPKGIPFESGYAQDREIIQKLSEEKKCTQTLRVDRGRHYIFCGAYWELPTVMTEKGWRCAHHRNT